MSYQLKHLYKNERNDRLPKRLEKITADYVTLHDADHGMTRMSYAEFVEWAQWVMNEHNGMWVKING